MKKYRPKKFILYFYGTVRKACISCYPQSRWELISITDKRVELANKHTSICITVEDFEQHWVEVKEKTNESND